MQRCGALYRTSYLEHPVVVPDLDVQADELSRGEDSTNLDIACTAPAVEANGGEPQC
jgi:hypothetical protein